MLNAIKNLLKSDKRFLFGFVVILILLFFAILSFFSPFDTRAWNVFPRDLPPSFENPLGTNSMGQDIFWRATEAIKNSIIMGLVAALVSRVIAITIGLTAGYRGGLADRILMTINDSFVIIPLFPVLILIAAIMRQWLNVFTLGLILGLFTWPWDARVLRSQILSLREREFTYTAVLSGIRPFRLMLREYLPFVIPLILATALNNLIFVIGMEMALAFLGLVSLSMPTLGTMIYWAVRYQAMFLGIWNWILTPVIICVFLILSLYMMSISISEFLDPRMRLQRIKAMKE
ncbi:ABC transporter permease [Candidatus Aerophobetes bacterium]|nr:ABC transporter permease [Candidatus Aerophobetes bacterium]